MNLYLLNLKFSRKGVAESLRLLTEDVPATDNVVRASYETQAVCSEPAVVNMGGVPDEDESLSTGEERPKDLTP